MAEAAAIAVALIAYNAWANLVVARPDRWYVLRGLALAAALLAVARGAGRSWDDLGLGGDAASGLAWGGAAALVAVLVLVAGLALPATRRSFGDARLAGMSPPQAAWYVFIRIPLGTVVLEEVAFRGVLPALREGDPCAAPAVALAAVAFGLWHLGPAVATARINGVPPGRRTVAVTAAAVAATALAGWVLAWLRCTSGSLLAPVLLHGAANSVGAGLAAWSRRRGWVRDG